MAAGPAIEMWSVQEGRASSRDGLVREYSRRRGFTVTLDSSDELEVVYQAAGLPLVGASLPGVPLCICRDLVPRRVSPILAIVTAEYSGQIGPTGIGTSSPILNPTKLSWGATLTDEPIDRDWNGAPIVTANGEPIDGLTERIPDLTLVASKKYLSINTYLLVDYLMSTNLDEFFGWPPGTVRFMGYKADAIFGSNQEPELWDVSAEFHFRRPFQGTVPALAWYKRVRHEGFKVRDTAGGAVYHGYDDGDPPRLLSRPVLLKEDGTVEPDNENAHFLYWQTLGQMPYNALGF